jgi:hypothetical protein
MEVCYIKISFLVPALGHTEFEWMFVLQFAAYLKKKNALGQKGEQKKNIGNDAESPKEVSVAGESLDSSPLALSLEDCEGHKLVSKVN